LSSPTPLVRYSVALVAEAGVVTEWGGEALRAACKESQEANSESVCYDEKERGRQGGRVQAAALCCRRRFARGTGDSEAATTNPRRPFPLLCACALEGGERVLGNKIQTRASASKQAIL